MRRVGARTLRWCGVDITAADDWPFCVVRRVRAGQAAKPFSLAETSLQATAAHWQYGVSAQDAMAELQLRGAVRAASAPIVAPVHA